jgi:putative Ca2+/H+ antiporter (TMEM165/GDT1 family)
VDLPVAATSFALVFPVELPDKTFVASLVLATRFRPAPVWIGVAAAFFVQTLVAVTAGRLLGLLPEVLVAAAAALLFGVGAGLLWRGTDLSEGVTGDERAAEDREVETPAWRAATTSFGVLFLAEWGDLSQLLTAGLSARYDDAVSVFVGAWLALATVAGLAVVLGRSLVQRVRLVTIRRVGAVICLTLALFSLYDVLRRLA